MTYTYLDLIEDVLRSEKRALSLAEIWEIACLKGLQKQLRSVGSTPINTMNACIRKHIKSSPKVRFRQISKKPALYYLNN
ncbi:winged helix-turn-helix domain-containing protein [Selenomonas ruminantium]|uniref:winged helix-turn-helix domain-containing protein n=1 Tax=Selenomonas ruminantium TaxID=971 RepID=UPI0034E987DE